MDPLIDHICFFNLGIVQRLQIDKKMLGNRVRLALEASLSGHLL